MDLSHTFGELCTPTSPMPTPRAPSRATSTKSKKSIKNEDQARAQSRASKQDSRISTPEGMEGPSQSTSHTPKEWTVYLDNMTPEDQWKYHLDQEITITLAESTCNNPDLTKAVRAAFDIMEIPTTMNALGIIELDDINNSENYLDDLWKKFQPSPKLHMPVITSSGTETDTTHLPSTPEEQDRPADWIHGHNKEAIAFITRQPTEI